MAEFGPAIASVLGHEGGYVNDPVDAGGETNWGISKRSYPKVDIKNLTRDQAVEIYRRDWWDKFGYGRISHQEIATKVFNLAVNMGAHTAHQLLQQALRAVELPTTTDGVLGAQTLMAVSLAEPRALLAALRSEAAGYYRTLVARKPAQARFKDGWLNRAYA